jgi:hypothetical protein
MRSAVNNWVDELRVAAPRLDLELQFRSKVHAPGEPASAFCADGW